ncbi:MAG: adenosylcobinamide-GDP ribazoletransferase [Tissierella sp.]|uniref:adenosylcobinamide-GDP ribazoletransferase n=1 Tax=Tissierella sp. TaxID=41274 RepID=UPI003F94B1A7
MIKGLILSIQFLTRIPLNINVDFNSENLKKSTLFYPFIGILLGSLSYGTHYIFSFINRDIASLITVIMMIVFTGGLHLDGLSDTADGFFSNKDKKKTLEIMKDSRVGAFGVISLILLILSKYIIISNFKEDLALALILSMGNSRLVTLFQIAFKKNARPGGLGDMICKSKPRYFIILSSLLYILLISFINIKYLIPLIFTILIGECISFYTYKKIDGFTGDVYGATIEIGETASLICFLEVIKWI